MDYWSLHFGNVHLWRPILDRFANMERPIFFALDKNEKIPQSYEKVQKNFKISGKIWKMITILQSNILSALPTTVPLLFTHIIHFWKSLFIFTKYMTIVQRRI